MARNDGRGWWYVPPWIRTSVAPAAAVLVAMGAASLVRAGSTFVVGWLFVVLGVLVGVCALVSQRRDDVARGRPARRRWLLVGGLVLAVAVGVAINLGLSAWFGRV